MLQGQNGSIVILFFIIVVGRCSLEFNVTSESNMTNIEYIVGTYTSVGVLNEKVVYRMTKGDGVNMYIHFNASSQNLNSGHWIVSTMFQSNQNIGLYC